LRRYSKSRDAKGAEQTTKDRIEGGLVYRKDPKQLQTNCNIQPWEDHTSNDMVKKAKAQPEVEEESDT